MVLFELLLQVACYYHIEAFDRFVGTRRSPAYCGTLLGLSVE